MTVSEARELVNGPLWPGVKRDFLATGTFQVYPTGDERRLAYLDKAVQDQIAHWMKAIPQIPAWRKVIDGKSVRQLKADYPGVYPEILRYAAYFPTGEATSKSLRKENAASNSTGEATSKSLHKENAASNSTGEATSKSLLQGKETSTSTSLPEPSQKNTLKTLLKLKFPEAYRLCYS